MALLPARSGAVASAAPSPPGDRAEGPAPQEEQRGRGAQEPGVLHQAPERIEQEIGTQHEEVRGEAGQQREHDPQDRRDGDAREKEEAEQDLEGAQPGDEDTGIVPVVDSEQSLKIVGVVTDRDLCMNVVAEGRDPRTVAVDACMTKVIVTCSPNDAVAKATELMKHNQIRRVPVVDDQGRLQGIVAMADLVGRGDLPMAETHEALKRVSTVTPDPSKPRARSRTAAA